MINHYLLLRRLAAELNEVLKDSTLVIAYSPQREDLQLHFEKTASVFTLKLNFATDFTLLTLWPEDPARPRHYEKQFTQLWGVRLLKVAAIAGERMLWLQFENGWSLWVRCFGRLGNVLLTDANQKLAGPFRRIIKNDYDFDGNLYTEESDFKKVINSAISENSIWWQKLPAELVTVKSDASVMLPLLEKAPLYRLPSNGQPGFYPDPPADAVAYPDVIAACNAFFKAYLPDFLLRQEKRRLMQPVSDKISRLEKKLAEHHALLKQLAKDSHFEHWGNLLLSAAHLHVAGSSFMLVEDYLTQKQVKIRLDPTKTVVENASRYFQKAKNQHIEGQQLENLKTITLYELGLLKQKLQELEATTQLRVLRKLAEKAQPENIFPFRRWTLQHLEIWMGKNAKQNDELLRLVHKDDLWLHARNHAGSHVVIRSAGKKIPQPVLEQAAAWAAWHSKGKTENLCAVMYTQRKYVRKPKGAVAGAVVVEKESTLLVHPAPPPAS